MAKRVTISVVSVLLVVGTVFGVLFYLESKDNTPSTDETSHLTESVDPTLYTETVPTEAVTETVPATKNSIDDGTNTDDITTTNFTFEKVVDHTTGEQVSPRVVFGSGFSMSDNYIKFLSDGSFEMYLSGYLSKTQKGTYVEYSDFVYVEFEDGNVYEYDIEHDDNGIISYIIVDYGDYSIYFS